MPSRHYGRRPPLVRGLLVLALLMPPARSNAQVNSIFGSAGFDYQHQSLRFGEFGVSRDFFHQQYTLGVDGRILDPRLATFHLSGSLGSTLLTEEEVRVRQFTGTLSLLQGKPYGVTLRHSVSASESATDTDISNTGATVRLTFPRSPQIFADFDRLALHSSGISPQDLTVTSGSVRVAESFQKGSLQGEVGVHRFDDDLRGVTEDRRYARAETSLSLSPATTFRFVGDGYGQDDQSYARAFLSLLNRPNANLARTLSLGYQSRQTGDEAISTVDTSGSLFKSFAFKGFTGSASISAFGTFGADPGRNLGLSGGGSLVVPNMRPLLFLAEYNMGLIYQERPGDKFGASHQAHLGLASRTLTQVRLSADYYFTHQSGFMDVTRHFSTLRAEGTIASRVSYRSSVDLLNERSDSEIAPRISPRQRLISAAAGASYRPIANLSLDLLAGLHRTETSTLSSTIRQASFGVNLVLPLARRPNLSLNAWWEDSSQDDRSRVEIRSRLSYTLRLLSLVVEDRYEISRRLSDSVASNSIAVSLVRTFSRSF